MRHLLLKKTWIAFPVFLCFSISVFAQAEAKQVHKLFSAKSPLEKISSGFSFTEGPAVDKNGDIYFTDQPNDRILKWSHSNGKIETYMEATGRSNGMYFDYEGYLITCADEQNQLWKISPDKKASVLVNDFEGHKLNGPNDLWIAPDGGMYFTDPFYKRDYWSRTEKEIETEDVYYLSPDGALSVAATNFVRPNGIVGTKDGKILYVADINDNKTYRFQIDANGILSNRELFIEMGSDGMTLDRKGNLYLTGKGVTVFSPKGEKITHIDVPENWTANIVFGGKKRKTLFITAMGAVYTLKMKVKGM